MLYFLVAIAIIALATYIFVLYQMSSNRKRIKILEARQLELANHPQDDKMQKIQKLALSGESLKTYQKWADNYKTLTHETFETINAHMEQAQDHNTPLHFPQSKTDIREVENELWDAEKQMADISQAFDKTLTKAEQNQAKVHKLRDQYSDMRKQLLTQSFAFGPALNALEEQLSDIETQFDAAESAQTKGDYLKEQSTLDKISDTLDKLKEEIKTTAPLYAQMVNDFTAQLNEQQAGFDQLRRQQFHFPAVDVPGEIAKTRHFQMDTMELLASLDLDTVQKRNDQESDAIDHIYDVMQLEIDSKSFVYDEQDKLTQFFAHAQRQNQTLLAELNHLDQSYVLNNHELSTAKHLQQRLQELQTVFDQDVQALAENRAIFSLVASDFKKWREDLKQLELTQVSIHETVAKMYESEKMANSSLKQFEAALRNVKRRVVQFNLPGLPKKYLDFYYVVSDEIKKLGHDLDQVKIDMDQITKQLIMTQEDIDKLKQQTEDLIDAASLGQQMLQYANKYRSENTDVATAVSDATRLFNIDYDYPAALDKVSTAIETVEPGAYKKIEDAYYKNKKDGLI